MEKPANNMKIVLLPGLDGTGELFNPLIECLADFSIQIIVLPVGVQQDYAFLVKVITPQLPAEDFILIAESFSGPIAAMLAHENIQALKAMVFIATFLSPPAKPLLTLSQFLPVKLLLSMPGSHFFMKYFLFGAIVDKKKLILFDKVIKALPAKLIKQRLKILSDLCFNYEINSLPAIYLQAGDDRLVAEDKYSEFAGYFQNISRIIVPGPHFLAQTQPKKCAKAIQKFIYNLNSDQRSRSLP